jgi:triphosphoribosyl-dephospho-CoA synthase
MMTPAQLSEIYKQACELELQAFKPGNVSVFSDGHDMTVEDFRISANVSADAITNPDYSLGEKIFYAVQATREAVGCNTNLGIILLCAPLITAAYQVSETVSLRQALAQVLANTTVTDADWVFKAISLAAPGGLGESKQQDVKKAATMTLTQAMEIASHRDRIALQYITEFKDIFDFAIFRYNEMYNCFFDKGWAVVAVYAGLLSRYPDSHIVRKYGNQHDDWVKEQMSIVDGALKTYTESDLIDLLYRIDYQFKSKRINPGTTADISVATILVVFLEELLAVNRKLKK